MPGATSTGSSGSDRRERIYQEEYTSTSGSVHSPESYETHSADSSLGDWSDLGGPPGAYDDLDSSGALPPKHRTSRRHTTEAPRPPSTGRRSTSRHVAVDEEEVHHYSHRHPQRGSRPYHRSESRRIPSDGAESVASADDHPYHHGMPRGYSGYRHVHAQSHGGHYPGMPSGGYPDPFQQQQALVQMPQVDAFGYPTNNPFSAPPTNPFSPMSTAGGHGGYFAEPQMPPQRPPPRPISMYGGSGYGHEMYGGGQPYPVYQYMYPPQGPPPQQDARQSATAKELAALHELMKKSEEAQIAREKAMLDLVKAEAAAQAAKEAKEKEEAKRKEEITAAQLKAKDDAEKAAKVAADKAKEESDKKLEESEKAKKAAEEKKKELEEQIKQNAPHPDAGQKPIKFKDAVNRKFSFPWAVCKTWKGMEGLIKQAFQHVENIGPHVLEGHYDLTGEDGEIILPQVWETTVKPGWEIEMHMWPLPELDMRRGDPMFDDMSLDGMMDGLDLGKKPKKGGSKKDKNKRKSAHVVEVPRGPTREQIMRGMAPPPPPMHGMGGVMDPVMQIINGNSGDLAQVRSKPRSGSSKGKKSTEVTGFAAWMAGGRPRRK